MLIYWLMYLIPAGMALFINKSRHTQLMLWFFIGFIFLIIIGFRDKCGCDWMAYLEHYESMRGVTFSEIFSGHGDPGHKVLNWLMVKLDWGVAGTNIIYGIIFLIGVFKFSRQQPLPWLAFAVAIPYLTIVVAMGYSRQGVALGLFLWAIASLQKGKFKTYVALILVAALIHKTAVLMLPLGVFLYGKGMTLRLFMIIPIAYGAWDILLADQQERLWKNYVEAQMQSEGAKIRVVMNLFPSLLLLLYRKEWKRSFNDYTFWFWIALGSIISVFLVGFASTAVDRMALYFIPIQLVVFSRLPYLARKQISPSIMKVIIVFGYTVILFVWLNFAGHSNCWIPYQNLLFQGLF